MKKIVVLFLAFMLISLSGCLWDSEQTFEEDGVSITLTDEYEVETSGYSGFSLVLVSSFAAILANVEAKSDFTEVYTLDEYTNLVLTQTSNPSSVTKYSEDDVVFNYATYEAESDGVIYKYLLVTKTSDTNYLTCNFAVQKSKFDKFYEDFLEAAKTITLE